VLQHEGRGKAKDHTEGHGDGELEEEDGDAMKKGGREDVLAVKLGERSGRRRRMEEGRLIGGRGETRVGREEDWRSEDEGKSQERGGKRENGCSPRRLEDRLERQQK
jgi:hypothetical protein